MNIPIRILVTGSRGKSSLTRLLHAGLRAWGLNARARITGVLPRELTPDGGERVIRRASPAHVAEFGWWLDQVPAETQALVAENSAVAPELQRYAPDRLRPTLVVWTTLRPDHTEVWGPGREGAAVSLLPGVPKGVPVAGGVELGRPEMRRLLKANGNALHVAPGGISGGHEESNLLLAALALSLALPGRDLDAAVRAMAELPPDLADFRILEQGGDSLAVAFSANDVASTAQLFAETGWDAAETTLLYHHRPDRTARLRDFLPWINSLPWRETVFSRPEKPLLSPPWGGQAWNDGLTGPEAFRDWLAGRGKVFACGNVAGWPLRFLQEERGA